MFRRHALFDDGGHRSGIVGYATGVGADLIVVGTQGRTNIRDLLLGSTAGKVLRESACSVRAVKPEGFARPPAVPAAPPSTQGR